MVAWLHFCLRNILLNFKNIGISLYLREKIEKFAHSTRSFLKVQKLRNEAQWQTSYFYSLHEITSATTHISCLSAKHSVTFLFPAGILENIFQLKTAREGQAESNYPLQIMKETSFCYLLYSKTGLCFKDTTV